MTPPGMIIENTAPAKKGKKSGKVAAEDPTVVVAKTKKLKKAKKEARETSSDTVMEVKKIPCAHSVVAESLDNEKKVCMYMCCVFLCQGTFSSRDRHLVRCYVIAKSELKDEQGT